VEERPGKRRGGSIAHEGVGEMRRECRGERRGEERRCQVKIGDRNIREERGEKDERRGEVESK
jgi:hypothetical protein